MVSSALPLTVTDAVVRKRGKTILGPISTTLATSGFTIVMGPNGAGKTTFLRLMHGLERPREGSVEYRVTPIEARKHTAFVFQNPIIMRRTVLDNIAYPLIIAKVGRKQARERAEQWGQKVGLGEMLGVSAQVLSGGERQKLAIARGLITDPELLFLDEPTTNLDGRSMREIETILLDTYEAGTRICMTTHHIGQAKRLAGDVIFIHNGGLCEYGSKDQFFNNTETLEARAFLRGDIVE